MTPILTALAAAGWIPGVLFSGHVLAGRLGAGRPVERWMLAPAVGLMLWTIPMLLAGATASFHPWIFGLAGWAVTALLARRVCRFEESPGSLINGSGLFVVALTVLYGVLSLAYSGEGFLGGRDQGGYANHALHLARTGSVWIPFPFESFGEARFGPLHFLQNLSNLSFMPTRMEAQFPPIYAIWMAQTAAVFGRNGVLWFNPVLAALTVPLLYRLARLVVGRPGSFVVLAVFLFNPVQIWIPRITLSEVAAQHFMAAALFCLTGGWLARKASLTGLGGLLIGFVFWIRIDGLVVMPALMVALIAVFIWGADHAAGGPSDRRLFQSAGWWALLAFLGGVVSHSVFTEQYFASIGPRLLMIVGLSALLLPLSLVFLNRSIREWTKTLLANRWIALILIGLLISILAWAYWVRPMVEPFAIFEDNPARGRTFRENSLVNLVAYLSEPAALLVLVGLVGAVWALFRGRIQAAWFVPLAVWAGFAALFLYDPNISPDHIWAMRRFVPVVLPGCALLAGFGFHVLIRRFPSPQVQIWTTAGVWLLLALVMIPRSSVFLFFQENRGSEAFLAELDARIPDGSLVFADTGTLFFDPLYPGLGHRVVRVDLDDTRMPAIIDTIIRENVAEGEPVFYLTQTHRDGLIEAEETNRFDFEYDFIAPTTTPPPTEIGHHSYRLSLYRSESAPSDPTQGYGDVTVGHLQVAGVVESGFYGEELNAFGPFRWTNGHARLVVPLRQGYRPRSIVLKIGDLPPGGDEVVVRVNGIEIYREFLAAAPGRFELDLPESMEGRALELELISGTFVPADMPGRGTDQRELGLCVYGVTLSDLPASKGTFELGPAPVQGVAEGGFHGAEFNELGMFRWTDGSAWLEVPLPAGYVVGRIDLTILDIPPGGTDFTLVLDGQVVYEADWSEPPGEFSVGVDGFEAASEGDLLRIELLSEAFRPVEVGLGEDERLLGLRLHSLVVTDRTRGNDADQD